MGIGETGSEEYTKKMRARYARLTDRKARGKLLDEFIEITDRDRKHANKVLLGNRRRKGRRGKRGAPRRYGGELGKALKICWAWTTTTAASFSKNQLYHRRKKHGIEQTRSRPYYKNDQAYVEQKNHTHVRQFLGHERLEYRELLEELNELLKLWSQWRNLFCVTMKQESKRRERSRQIHRHEKKGRTLAQRPIDSGELRKEEEQEALTLTGAPPPLRTARKGKQTNNQKPSRYGVLIMRQRSRSSRKVSECSIYEATGNKWRFPLALRALLAHLPAAQTAFQATCPTLKTRSDSPPTAQPSHRRMKKTASANL